MQSPRAAASQSDFHLRLGFALLALLAVGVYLPSLGHRFVNLDDPQYITDNPYVLDPGWVNLRRVFVEVWNPTTVAGYYQPLTMASLMVDSLWSSAFGAAPGAPDPRIFHGTNILLHALNAVLCAAWLVRLTGGTGRAAAFAAALLFAVHPVNVEVVSWVCQRKALLSTTFALAALIAYDAQIRRPGGGRAAIAALCLILSLLAKPTGWLLPLFFILLDIGMYRRASLRTAVVEKLPLLLISLVGGAVAFVSQRQSMGRARVVPLEDPLEAAWVVVHNVGFYLSKLIFPIELSTQYPLPQRSDMRGSDPALLLGAATTVVLLGVSVRAIARRQYAFLAAMLGYFILLGPAIGAVEYMGAIAADRFQYLPMLAPLAGLAWWLSRGGAVRDATRGAGRPTTGSTSSPEAISRSSGDHAIGTAEGGSATGIESASSPGAILLIAAVAIAFAARTVMQQSVWRDSVSYYQSALTYAPTNPDAIYGLGRALYERTTGLGPGDASYAADMREAGRLFEQTITARPGYSLAYFGLAELLVEQGEAERALEFARRGLEQPAADESGLFVAGLACSKLSRHDEAARFYEQYLSRRPRRREALRNLANAYAHLSRWPQAERRYAELVELDPRDEQALYGLGMARLTRGANAEAVAPLQRACAQAPKNAIAHFALASALARIGSMPEAEAALVAALRLDPALAARAAARPELAGLLERTGMGRTSSAPFSSGSRPPAPATRP